MRKRKYSLALPKRNATVFGPVLTFSGTLEDYKEPCGRGGRHCRKPWPFLHSRGVRRERAPVGILGHEWEYHKVTRHLMEDSLRLRPDTADFKAGKFKCL